LAISVGADRLFGVVDGVMVPPLGELDSKIVPHLALYLDDALEQMLKVFF